MIPLWNVAAHAARYRSHIRMNLSSNIVFLKLENTALYVLLAAVLMTLVVFASLYWYFRDQSKTMNNAITQIQKYIAGNRDARIECDDEGDLYRLFHEVNSLVTILNAHAENERRAKTFMKNTISDISHQLKTPLAALNIYNGLMQEEVNDSPELKEFTTLSEQELDRIETLVQNLLKITKLDAGTITLEKSTQNVSDMMGYIERHFACQAQQEEKSLVIEEIQTQYHLPESSIRENTVIMGLAGQSSNESMQNIYGIAAVLFVLVLLAGILMISGSMNSNVAQRTKFFGMMRCIGASSQQIIRFVRLEALNWCKIAIPLGLILGTVITWAICTLLRYGIGGEFSAVPVFALSPIGLISGAVVGLVTVLLAAQAPAKRAAKVSPVAAVSGSSESASTVRHSARPILNKIEWTLGVHHATASKKNWFLMTASFSLSIILFLCFAVILDFAHELVPSLRSWQPDITLNGYANALLLEPDLLAKIQELPHVKTAYGTAYIENVPATSSREEIDHVNLMSYTDDLLDSVADSVVEGDLSSICGNNRQVMTINNKDNPLQVGDTIQIFGKEVTITCSVSDGVYSSEYSVICSPETFEWLTGETNYSLIGIQLDADAAEETIRQINNLVGNDVIFDDLRKGNQEDAATYLAAQFVLYSFLAILAMITLFHIINSISMSVTARIRQYGAMRAVGMDGSQLTRMIIAEALTYAISGLAAGCGIGLVLSRSLHIMLLTRYFGIAWSLPVPFLCIIIVFDFTAAFLAVYAPSRRIRDMAITDTINEL